MPSSRQARRMRMAISPRFAIRIFLNMEASLRSRSDSSTGVLPGVLHRVLHGWDEPFGGVRLWTVGVRHAVPPASDPRETQIYRTQGGRTCSSFGVRASLPVTAGYCRASF